MGAKGVGCSVHYIPLHLHPYWRDTYGLHEMDYPNSLHVYEHAVSLPLYTRMNDEQQVYVIECVKELTEVKSDALTCAF